MQTQATAGITLELPPTLRDRLENLAKARNSSMHALMVQGLEAFIEREEKRETLRQEARIAHEEYIRTGLHLRNDEVIAWMDKMIEGKKEPMPPCHI